MTRRLLRPLRRARRLIRNAVLDLRYGGFLGGTVPTRYAHRHAHDTANTDYDILAAMFNGRIAPSDVLVDVGCGKGRAINWWLSRRLGNTIVGIELDPQIAARTRRRLRKHPGVTILTGNALEWLPPDGTLFFLHNPFDLDVLRRFKHRLTEVTGARPGVRIIYYNPLDLDLFAADPAWTVQEFAVVPPWDDQAHPWAVIAAGARAGP